MVITFNLVHKGEVFEIYEVYDTFEDFLGQVVLQENGGCVLGYDDKANLEVIYEHKVTREKLDKDIFLGEAAEIFATRFEEEDYTIHFIR